MVYTSLMNLLKQTLQSDIDLFELGMLYGKKGTHRIDALREVMPKLHPEAIEVSPGIWMNEELYNQMITKGI